MLQIAKPKKSKMNRYLNHFFDLEKTLYPKSKSETKSVDISCYKLKVKTFNNLESDVCRYQYLFITVIRI